jgi:DNA-binding PucR family transcriptional regulator
VGGVADSPAALRQSVEEATIAATVGWRLGAAHEILYFEQLGLYRLLTKPAGQVDLELFVRQVLGPVLDHDERSGGDWIGFLEHLVACNFSVKAAARRAGLHVNTAKYRAARIEALLGVDLSDPDVRFDLQLALKIRALGRLHGSGLPALAG